MLTGVNFSFEYSFMNRYMLIELKFHAKKMMKYKFVKVKGKISKRDSRDKVLTKQNKLQLSLSGRRVGLFQWLQL